MHTKPTKFLRSTLATRRLSTAHTLPTPGPIGYAYQCEHISEVNDPGYKYSVEKRKLIYYHTLYKTISSRNWGRVNRLLSQFRSEGLHYDEVMYTFLVHTHILSPTSRCENAYLVIEEMKQAQMHPAIIRMNQMLINSYLELSGIHCQPPKNAWQNILRMAWQSSLSFIRSRKKELVKTLEKMPPDQLLSLSAQDIDEMVKQDNLIHSTSCSLSIEESQDIPMALGDNLEYVNELDEDCQLQELQRQSVCAILENSDSNID